MTLAELSRNKDWRVMKDYMKQRLEELDEGKKALLDRGLGKWCFLLVTGKTVTTEQALDFIFRTDGFFTGDGHTGNNTSFEKKLCNLFGMIHGDDINMENLDEQMEQNRKVEQRLDHVRLSYLESNQLSSCYIGGPTGIVNPEGKVFYAQNVGKYPETEEIYFDLLLLADTFPWLELVATLHYGEDMDQPIVSFVVKEGTVDILSPKEAEPLHEKDLEDRKDEPARPDFHENLMARMQDERRADGRTMENAIPFDVCREYLEQKGFDTPVTE